MTAPLKRHWPQTILVIAGLLFTFCLCMPQLLVGQFGHSTPRLTQSAPIPPLRAQDADKQHERFHFFAVGDTGAGTTAQGHIANQLLAHQQRTPAAVLLHLGDLVYPRGDFTHTGNRLYTHYYQPLEEAGLPIKPVLGNHDILDGYHPKALEFYNIPNRYYQYQLTQNGITVDFFALDTNIFQDPRQQQWLKSALKNSTANFKIVYGHHPIFSSGMHGNSKALQQTLQPLLSQYHVNMYLSGHEHDYERFEPIDGVLYVVSGGGGAYLRQFKPVQAHSQAHSKVRLSKHHYLHITLSKDGMIQGQAINSAGKLIDSFSIPASPPAP